MSATTIEWTEQTWNPVVGCQYVHEGCRNCYAATMTRRLAAMGQEDYVGLTTANHFNGKVRCLPDKLDIPLRRRKPTEWFVNSMSDLFHPDVPFEFIDRVFAVMALTPRHRFMVLTKRAGRMREYFATTTEVQTVAMGGFTTHNQKLSRSQMIRLACNAMSVHAGRHNSAAYPTGDQVARGESWPLPNVALGVSVSHQATADALIPDLLATPARWRFVSYEPALGAVDFERWMYAAAPSTAGPWTYPSGRVERGACSIGGAMISSKPAHEINGIIFGGESGPGARPCNVAWARSTRDQCNAAGVDFFCKQLGSKPYESAADGPAVRAWGDARIQVNGEFVQIHLRDRKGGDEAAWPEDLRGCRRLPWREGRDV